VCAARCKSVQASRGVVRSPVRSGPSSEAFWDSGKPRSGLFSGVPEDESIRTRLPDDVSERFHGARAQRKPFAILRSVARSKFRDDGERADKSDSAPPPQYPPRYAR
jgi:hypothetical protein